VRLLAQRAATSSICPSEVARALAPDEAAWRALMPQVREVAQSMSDANRVRITRGGAPVARADLHHGAVRLSRGPRFDA
jgi:Protein of unknown function (DUF3253)